MHILIAPNTFKNALAADETADCIATGLKKSRLSFSSETFPVGDGGDGTGTLLIKKTGAKIIEAEVRNPLGKKINASFGLTGDGTAIIELANASGLRLIRPEEYDPLRTSTCGTGDLIKAALDKNVKRIFLCIGGSATVDGGTGVLQTLGVQFLDSHYRELSQLPENLKQLAAIDSSLLDQRLVNTELIILCDVDNKLLGKKGAAAVFGPQKGAKEKDVWELEKCLSVFTDKTYKKTGINMNALIHGGAAGGVAAGLAAFLKAKLANGADFFLDYTDFDHALQQANWVITGEGSLDEQTQQGKAPYAVAVRAKKKQIKVAALAGKIDIRAKSRLRQYFDILLPINEEPFELRMALGETPDNLIKTARKLGDWLSREKTEIFDYT
ncbi:MAG TPA: glycerate kinase [Puia sp.]|nr:glycerate kinase [Puia sp.]